MIPIEFSLNGQAIRVEVDQDELLLDTLRRRMDLRSVRYSCGIGVCGSCTVLLDDLPASSCLLLTQMVRGRSVRTAEQVLRGPDGGAGEVAAAFVVAQAYQCSYCIPAIALTVDALRRNQPDATADELCEQLGGNLCRCGSYPQVMDAIARLTTSE